MLRGKLFDTTWEFIVIFQPDNEHAADFAFTVFHFPSLYLKDYSSKPDTMLMELPRQGNNNTLLSSALYLKIQPHYGLRLGMDTLVNILEYISLGIGTVGIFEVAAG